MKISKKAHYGLQACYYLMEAYPTCSVSAKELEKKIAVSSKYLEQIMRALSKKEIVGASRGVTGGYFLNKDPKEISVGEIVRALEENLEIIACVKKTECTKCPSANIWRKLHKGINELLDDIKLVDMKEGL